MGTLTAPETGALSVSGLARAKEHADRTGALSVSGLARAKEHADRTGALSVSGLARAREYADPTLPIRALCYILSKAQWPGRQT
jgi:hypothetical protein